MLFVYLGPYIILTGGCELEESVENNLLENGLSRKDQAPYPIYYPDHNGWLDTRPCLSDMISRTPDSIIVGEHQVHQNDIAEEISKFREAFKSQLATFYQLFKKENVMVRWGLIIDS